MHVIMFMDGFKTLKNHLKISKNQLFCSSVMVVENASFGHSDEGTYAKNCCLGGKLDFEMGGAKYHVFSLKKPLKGKKNPGAKRPFYCTPYSGTAHMSRVI